MATTRLGAAEIERSGGWTLKQATMIAGRYRLDRPMGRGSWQATDHETGERVFLKTGPPGNGLEREADVLAAVAHPGIVRLRDSGSAGERPFIVLDLVEGDDLEAVLGRAGARLDQGGLTDLMCRLGEAVGAVHAAGYLHRDLKPANIVVRADGSPVIVDLGAALPIARAAAAPPDSLVTAGYGAPEQYLTDQPEGPWTDVYGLGAIAYRALSGAPPKAAPERLRGASMPAATSLAGGAAGPLHRAVDRALEVEPAARPQTVSLWTAALRSSADAPGIGLEGPWLSSVLDDYPPTVRIRRAPRAKVAGSVTPMPPPAVRPRHRRAAVGLAVALLLALGAGVAAAAAWYGKPLYERYVKIAWVVDPSGGGDALTIADAIARAADNAIIEIRPGTYAESLVIDRPVHLRPAVPGTAPLIAPEAGPCIRATSDGGSVTGLHFKGPEPADPEAVPDPCLLIAGGSLRAEGNRITGGTGPAVLIRDGSEPVISGNTIEDRTGPGIVVAAGARGQISQNTITGVAGPSLIVRSGAAPLITDTTIEGSGPVVFAEGATGTLEGNRITSSLGSAIEVTTGADPLVVDNQVGQAGGAGVFVYDHGRGRFERNLIVGSALSGVVVTAGGDPELTGNAIRESKEQGVLIVEGGRARLEGNAIEANAGHGIAIGTGAEAELTDNQLAGNAEPQLRDGRGPEPEERP